MKPDEQGEPHWLEPKRLALDVGLSLWVLVVAVLYLALLLPAADLLSARLGG